MRCRSESQDGFYPRVSRFVSDHVGYIEVVSELRDHAERRTRRDGKSSRWPDWGQALTTAENEAVAAFVRANVKALRRGNPIAAG